MDVTRIKKTEEDYAKKASSLLTRYEKETGKVWDSDFQDFNVWLKSIRSGLMKASWRQYRAALIYYLGSLGADNEQLKLVKNITTAKCKRKSNKTSTQKEKKITQEEMETLVEFFSEQKSKWDSLLISWLQSAIITGLRPQEWETVQLDGFKLIVKNAKNTNGRCFSSHRTLDLSRISEDDYDDLETFISQLNLYVREHGNSFEHVYKQCRNRLYKVTRKIWPGRNKYPALYTGRHQFSANAKKNQNLEEVAALMGHKNNATATEHYGKKVHGEKKTDMVLPDPNEVALVERTFTMPDFNNPSISQIDRRGEPT